MKIKHYILFGLALLSACKSKDVSVETKSSKIAAKLDNTVDKCTVESSPECNANRGEYPNLTLMGVENADKLADAGTSKPNEKYKYFKNLDSLAVLDPILNPGVVRTKRVVRKLLTTACGCDIEDVKYALTYYILIGIDKDNNELLGPSQIFARPCPDQCYGQY